MKKIFTSAVVLCLVVMGYQYAHAMTDVTTDQASIVSAFKNVFEVSVPAIVVPTVIEVQLPNSSIERTTVQVMDVTDNKFISSLFTENFVSPLRPRTIVSDGGVNLPAVNDQNYESTVQFDLPETGVGRVTLTAQYAQDITTDNLEIHVDRYVALPTSVSIYSYNAQGVKTIVVNNIRPQSSSINFPKLTSKKIEVELYYAQPLRVSELYFGDISSNTALTSSLRFLAQPGHTYRVYVNPDSYVNIPRVETPNLRDNEGVKKATLSTLMVNAAYVKPDTDNDGIVNELDNCVSVSNFDQVDVDTNGRGDACDDFDKDGLINSIDNCVNEPNRNQADIDRDGLGDVCDGDESRFTEKYPMLVWLGIIFAVCIFGGLYFTAFKGMRKANNQQAPEDVTTTQ